MRSAPSNSDAPAGAIGNSVAPGGTKTALAGGTNAFGAALIAVAVRVLFELEFCFGFGIGSTIAAPDVAIKFWIGRAVVETSAVPAEVFMRSRKNGANPK